MVAVPQPAGHKKIRGIDSLEYLSSGGTREGSGAGAKESELTRMRSRSHTRNPPTVSTVNDSLVRGRESRLRSGGSDGVEGSKGALRLSHSGPA